jgi:hypothetical protein
MRHARDLRDCASGQLLDQIVAEHFDALLQRLWSANIPSRSASRQPSVHGRTLWHHEPMVSLLSIAGLLVEDAFRWVLLLFRSAEALRAENLFLAQTTIEDVLTGQTGGGRARLTLGDSNVRETRDRTGAPPSGSHLGPHDHRLAPRATRPSLEWQSVPRSVFVHRCALRSPISHRAHRR